MTDKTFHVYCQFDALFSLIKKQLQSRLEKYALLPGHVMLLKTLKEQPVWRRMNWQKLFSGKPAP